MTITGQTFANSDVVAGQKFYASNYLALIAQMQALNDELVAECVALAGNQTIAGIKTFSSAPVFSAGANMGSAKITNVLDPAANQDAATKKWVEDNVTPPEGGAPTKNDSGSDAMLKAHAYKAQTAGFVSAYVIYAGTVQIYVDNTTNPAGAGDKIADQGAPSSNGHYATATAFVPKDYYFEITVGGGGGTPTIYWTPLVSSGGAPIDQD